MSGGASLDGVLSLIESFGTVVVLARNLEAIATNDTRAALHAAGVIAASHPAVSWPCDQRGCAREIRANYDGAPRPLVAVCFQAPAACAPVELGFDEVAQQQVSADALVTATCALLGAAVDRAALAKVRARRAVGDFGAPVAVATLADPSREVFWAGRPREVDLGAWCARRERASRRTLVLVPTMKHVPLEVASRFLPRETVEVRALADLIEVRDGKLALVEDDGGIGDDTSDTADGPIVATLSPGIAALLGAKRWEEIQIVRVDAHTVRLEANGKALLRTFVELGFVDGRKREIVTPTMAWSLLLVFCRSGRLKPSEYSELGEAYGAKKTIERMGKVMCRVFGLKERPIHTYSKRAGLWEARFRVAEGG